MEMTKMEDDQKKNDQNVRRPKWKTSKMEDNQNGKRPKLKTAKIEEDKFFLHENSFYKNRAKRRYEAPLSFENTLT